MNHGHTRWRAVLGLLLLSLGLRAVGLVRPCLSDDEATYSVVASELRGGKVLYRDVVDHKPPLIYATYAATQVVAGRTGGMLLLHAITALVVLATGLLLARIARRVQADAGGAEDDDAPVWAALLYVVFTATLFDYDALASNCELFMLLPLVGSVLVYLAGTDGGRPRPALLAASGALVAVAAFYKYQAMVQLPLYAVHLALAHRRSGVGRILAGWLALAAGAALVVAAAVGVAVHYDAWSSAWFWFRFNFAYVKQGLAMADVRFRAVRVAYGVVPAALLWIAGLSAAARAVRLRAGSPQRLDLFLVGWLAVSGFAVTAGGRFFGHYFHQTTAPLAALAAPVLARLDRRRPALARLGMAVPAGLFFVLGIAHGSVMAAIGQPDPDYPAMAAFIDAHAAPTDRLLIWGNTPVLYFDAGRPLGSRFVFSNYMTGLSPATRTQSDPRMDASANIVPQSWDMLLADIAERRPELFVDTSPGNVAAYGKFPLASFPRLKAIVDRDYSPIGEVGGVRVFVSRAKISSRPAAKTE
ncbi:MAG TPA: hypothetical protein VMT03_01500 [Polyangia bacterium]|nr:hypothetical protein [Polyangia bacterium]